MLITGTRIGGSGDHAGRVHRNSSATATIRESSKIMDDILRIPKHSMALAPWKLGIANDCAVVRYLEGRGMAATKVRKIDQPAPTRPPVGLEATVRLLVIDR